MAFELKIKFYMYLDFKNIEKLYKDELLLNVIPFWLEKSQDLDYGGYFTCLDRRGEVFDTDKFIWLQGRQVWMFSTTCPFVRGMYQKPVSRNTINSLAESSSRSCVIRTITEPSSATFISSIQGYLVPNIS